MIKKYKWWKTQQGVQGPGACLPAPLVEELMAVLEAGNLVLPPGIPEEVVGVVQTWVINTRQGDPLAHRGDQLAHWEEAMAHTGEHVARVEPLQGSIQLPGGALLMAKSARDLGFALKTEEAPDVSIYPNPAPANMDTGSNVKIKEEEDEVKKVQEVEEVKEVKEEREVKEEGEIKVETEDESVPEPENEPKHNVKPLPSTNLLAKLSTAGNKASVSTSLHLTVL